MFMRLLDKEKNEILNKKSKGAKDITEQLLRGYSFHLTNYLKLFSK